MKNQKPDQNAVTMIQELSDAKRHRPDLRMVSAKNMVQNLPMLRRIACALYLRSKNNTGNKPVFYA